MKAPRIRAVEMVRKIRDRQARRLAGKSPEEIITFYRAAGEAGRGTPLQAWPTTDGLTPHAPGDALDPANKRTEPTRAALS